MKKNDIASVYTKVLTTQEYGKDTPIAGIAFIPLVYHRDDSGEFTELVRVDDGKVQSLNNFQLAQVSSSLLLPGAVKAFHLHFDQTDAWFVSPHERLLVGLLDTRTSSPTLNVTMRFILGAGVAQLAVIPPGVAHGAANLWDKPATMTYFTDRPFNPVTPDEHRLPYDLFGKEFWTLGKG